MIKFAVLSIVGIMPVVNLHQWDTQLENIDLPLLSDIILLHIQNYPNIKNSGYFYGTAGILESKKKKQHIFIPILALFQEYPDRYAPKPFSLLVVSVSPP